MAVKVDVHAGDGISASVSGHEGLADQLQAAVFDPVSFLNESLPTLTISSQANTTRQSRNSHLQNAATETQSLLNKLNAESIRSSSELSHLTDEIFRSANRLAYEVEVLRGDVNNLHDVLSDTLMDDIKQFVRNVDVPGSATAAQPETVEHSTDVSIASIDPKFMQELRLLGHVKSRLESVTKVFGEAMSWPVVPSEISMASSLISVSAPELGVASSAEDDKARATIKKFRDEITYLLNSDGGGQSGLDAASKRVAEFQDLAMVWKGTIEEKARNRTVESFARIVEERRRQLNTSARAQHGGNDGLNHYGGSSRSGTPSVTGGGLFGGLRKLRDEIYLD